MSTNIDSILFTEAKQLLREYHNSFEELKKKTKKMLETHLQIRCSDDLVEWTAYVIRMEDWKTFSADRIKKFDSDGKDFSDWLATTIISGNVTDKWFKPYVEKEELTEAETLADKLTIGMRGSYWLADKKKAESCLQQAIEELKTTSFEPAADFKLADYYLEMVNNQRYSEASDLIAVFNQLVLDKRSKERVLAQALAVSMACNRLDVSKKTLEYAEALESIKWAPLSFNMACYFATAGKNEEQMYRYIVIALENGKHDYDFKDSDFNAYRQSIKFKAIISGKTVEEAELQEALADKLTDPATIVEAEDTIRELHKAAQHTENAIETFLGIESECDGEPADVLLLDEMMYRFKKTMTPDALVYLFEIAFPSMESNYQVALEAVNEINSRKDTASQMRISDAFMKAGTYYDAGHRMEESTVHDQLIDTYFADFTNEALIYLLEQCDTQYLAADGMHHLFVVLLERKPDNEITERAYKRFAAYFEKEGSSDYYDFQFDSLFSRLTPLLPNEVMEKVSQVKAQRT